MHTTTIYFLSPEKHKPQIFWKLQSTDMPTSLLKTSPCPSAYKLAAAFAHRHLRSVSIVFHGEFYVIEIYVVISSQELKFH
jgi:hypothetical protein